jgi:hypothetical protein
MPRVARAQPSLADCTLAMEVGNVQAIRIAAAVTVSSPPRMFIQASSWT